MSQSSRDSNEYPVCNEFARTGECHFQDRDPQGRACRFRHERAAAAAGLRPGRAREPSPDRSLTVVDGVLRRARPRGNDPDDSSSSGSSASEPDPPPVPRQRYVLNGPVGAAGRARLEAAFPDVDFVDGAGSNPHPEMAAARNLCERIVYDEINSARGRDPERSRWIVDVGQGHGAIRALRRGLTHVFGLCPDLDASDVARLGDLNTAVPDPAHRRWAVVTVGEFLDVIAANPAAYTAPPLKTEPHEVVSPAYFVFIHSLYYIPPIGRGAANNPDILDIVFGCSERVAYAVVHPFRSARAVMAGGEASYAVDHKGMVTMNVRGNNARYYHGDLFWLRATNGGHRHVDGAYRVLVWTLHSIHGDSEIWKFTGQERADVPPSYYTPFAPPTFVALLEDKSYYGPAAPPPDGPGFGAADDPDRPEYAAELGHVDFTSRNLYSCGGVVVVGSPSKTSVLVPKSLVYELMVYMANRARTADTWKLVNQRAKDLAKKGNIPRDIAADAISYAAALAYSYGAERDYAIASSVLQAQPSLHAADKQRALIGVTRKTWVVSSFVAGCIAVGIAGLIGVSVVGRDAYTRRHAAEAAARMAARAYSDGLRDAEMSTILGRARALIEAGFRLQLAGASKRNPDEAPPTRPIFVTGSTGIMDGIFRRLRLAPAVKVPPVYAMLLRAWITWTDTTPNASSHDMYHFIRDPLARSVLAIVVAPLYEEAMKRSGSWACAYLANLLGYSDKASDASQRFVALAGGAVFALFEDYTQYGHINWPRVAMHSASAALPYWYGVALHAAWNSIAIFQCAASVPALLQRTGVDIATLSDMAMVTGPAEIPGFIAAVAPVVSLFTSAASLVSVGTACYRVWRDRRVTARDGAILLAGALFAATPFVAPGAVAGLHFAQSLVVIVSVVVGRSGLVAGCAAVPVAPSPGFAPGVCAEYSLTRSAVPPPDQPVWGPMREPTWLPATITRLPVVAMTFSAKFFSAGTASFTRRVFLAAGLCLATSPPLVFASHPRNVEVAFCARQAALQPNEAKCLYPYLNAAGHQRRGPDLELLWLDYSPHDYAKFRAYIESDLRAVFPGATPDPSIVDGDHKQVTTALRRPTPERYIARFPESQAPGLIAAADLVASGELDDADLRRQSGFSKVENLTKVTCQPLVEAKPRMIISTGPAHRMVVGPPALATSELVGKTCWHYNNDEAVVTYGPGLNATELGAMRESHLAASVDGCDLESDGVGYDSTTNMAAKELEWSIYAFLGWTEFEIETDRKATKHTSGRLKDGSRFHVDARTQSGIPTTSLGHTIRNGTMSMYKVARVGGFVSDSDFEFVGYRAGDPNRPIYRLSPDAIPIRVAISRMRAMGVRIAVGGDDQYETVPLAMLTHMGPEFSRAAALSEYSRRSIAVTDPLGVRLENVLHLDERRALTFFSGLFMPSSLGLVHSPLPFRCLAKVGYYATAEAELFHAGRDQHLALVHGDALGRVAAVSHVPILGEFFRHLAKLSRGPGRLKPGVLRRLLRPDETRKTVTAAAAPVAATYEMFEALYPFADAAWRASVINTIESVDRIPAMWDHPGMAEGLLRDTGLSVVA